MKRLLLTLAVLFASTFAFAQGAGDVIVTHEGTVYTIDAIAPPVDLETGKAPSKLALRVNVQSAEGVSSIWVPETLTGGTHHNATIAWDRQTGSLYVFWVKMPNPMSTELMFASYRDGVWTETSSIDNSIFTFRKNLQIVVTDWGHEWQVSNPETGEGSMVRVSAPAVHAAWWQQDGYGESAQYALIALDNGAVSSISVHDLRDVVAELQQEGAEAGTYEPLSPLDPDFNRDFYEHPALQPNAALDAVDVFFADETTDTLHRIGLSPVRANGVLTIPIPSRLNGVLTIPIPLHDIRPPMHFNSIVTGPIETIMGDGDEVLVHFEDNGVVRYLHYEDGVWTELRGITLDGLLGRDRAVNALRSLVAR